MYISMEVLIAVRATYAIMETFEIDAGWGTFLQLKELHTAKYIVFFKSGNMGVSGKIEEATTTQNVLVQGALSIEIISVLSILKSISSHIHNRLHIVKLDHPFNTLGF